MDFQVHLKKAQLPRAGAGLFTAVSMLVRTPVHKGGEMEYVVMQVQPHPSIVITRPGHAVPEGGSYKYIPCIEQRI